MTPTRRVVLELEIGRLAAQLDRLGHARYPLELRTAELLSLGLDRIAEELAALAAPVTKPQSVNEANAMAKDRAKEKRLYGVLDHGGVGTESRRRSPRPAGCPYRPSSSGSERPQTSRLAPPNPMPPIAPGRLTAQQLDFVRETYGDEPTVREWLLEAGLNLPQLERATSRDAPR
jgi:hypothetical protein